MRAIDRIATHGCASAYPFLVVLTGRVLSAVVVLVVMTVLGLLGWLRWPDSGIGKFRIAIGTVVSPAQCGPHHARDTLRIDLLDGRAVPAYLDGCGNRIGEVLTVEVPDPLPAGEVVVRLAGTGVPAGAALAQRISVVLLAVAGIAGAVLAWRLRNT